MTTSDHRAGVGVTMRPRLAVIGNPGNRRVALFDAAVRRAGLSAPVLLPWRSVAAAVARGGPWQPPAGALRPGTVLRVDSPGEDAEVSRLLRGAPVPAAPGEITDSAPWYAGFRAALRLIAGAADLTGARLAGDPDEIAVMFDKAACHARLAAAGVSVPPALPDAPRDWADLRGQLAAAGWRRVFVKPRHGSSASGVLALESGPAGRLRATTSVQLTGRGLFNSLRVRRYERESEVAAIVDRLAPAGLHVERWFPKAALAGRVVDLRVVVVAGEPTHVVVRGSRSPMTNLHLGAVRADLDAFRAAAGSCHDAVLDTCRAVAACFPGSLMVAVDAMCGVGFRRHAVAEVNAFGDLLPGLLVAGRDTYDAQVAALLTAGVPARPGSPSWT